MNDNKTSGLLFRAQVFEKTEYCILRNLSRIAKKDKDKQTLDKLAKFSLKHHDYIKTLTEKDVEEKHSSIIFYVLIARTAGMTFCLKLLEKRECTAIKIYEKLSPKIPHFEEIIEDERQHETELVGLIDEEIIKYIGSVVLGLNDALVELTGALAGFTLAMQNNKLIGSAGLITGIAASLSMASSEYLSVKTENGDKNPIRASLYTGITYIFTVLFLIFPYFVSNNYLVSLAATLSIAALIITLFSFYTSVTQGASFIKKFTENITISFGIALISFLIGYLVRTFLHLQI